MVSPTDTPSVPPATATTVTPVATKSPNAPTPTEPSNPPTPLPLPPSALLSPVPGYPGVFTKPEFSAFSLGIVPSHDLLCCIACPRLCILYCKTAATHLKDKHGFTGRTLEDQIRQLVHNASLSTLAPDRLPKPNPPAPPYPFLPVNQHWRCKLCHQKGVSWYGTSVKNRSSHFRDNHKEEGREGNEDLVQTQTFAPYIGSPAIFEVHPELSPHTNQELEDLFALSPGTSDELVKSFMEHYQPLEFPRPQALSIKDTHPFLDTVGWPTLIQNLDPNFLCELVCPPDPSKEPGMLKIFDATIHLFKAEHQHLQNHKYPPIWMTAIMDDGSSQPSRPFRALQATAVQNYATMWARWVVFVLRLYQTQKSGDTRFPVTITPNQTRALDRALLLCKGDPSAPRPARVLADLASWFWLPSSESYFEHLAVDQFDDPTVRFAALINLRPNGSFLTPGNCTHNMVQIKYFMRLGLLMWSRMEAEETRGKHTGLLTPRYLGLWFESCLGSIVARPPRSLSYAQPLALVPRTRSPRFISPTLCGRRTLNIDGETIVWSHFRERFSTAIQELASHVQSKILLGIPLEDFSFTVTENDKIHDEFARTDLGYSFLTDPRNPFMSMSKMMASVFFRDPRASHLHRGLDTNKRIVWNDLAVNQWLNDCKWATERLAFLMHVSGGQPGRGVELSLLQVLNPLYRLRGIYYLGPGRLVFVLFYNKTTSNTGKDWIVAHAIPWCISRWFLVMHSLVNPLIGQLLLRLPAGANGQYNQLTSAFASLGKPLTSDRLGDIIQTWFRDHMSSDLRLLRLRQTLIACQRRFMPEAYSPIRKAIHILDAQAGHTSEIAASHYAIDATEVHLLAPDSVTKEVAASARWWSVLIDPSLLTAGEVSQGRNAPMIIAQEEGNEVRPFFDQSSIPTLASSIASSLQGSGFLSNFADSVADKVLARLASHSPSTPGAPLSSMIAPPEPPISPAPRTEIFPEHLDVLRRFTQSPVSVFSSTGQAQALAHTLSRKSSLIVVLPTGIGKSLIFSCLPLVETGATFVVFPLRALLQDQVSASEKRQHMTPFNIWKPRQPYVAGINAVSVEDAASPQFSSCAVALNQVGLLNRLIFDEVHQIVTEQSYRQVMHNLNDLVQHGVPIVGLTATLPPAMQYPLRQALGSPSLYLVRESTSRRNIFMRSGLFLSPTDALSALQRHCRRYLSELQPREGIMIICRTTEEVSRLRDEMGIPGYFSQLDPSIKDTISSDWVSGKERIVVCTTALGTGVNHPACRAVIHFGLPWGFVNYAQESGRAGRDGLPALSIIFWWGAQLEPEGLDPKGLSELVAALYSGTCLRSRMSSFIDGPELMVSCTSGDYAPCGPCTSALSRASQRSTPDISLATHALAASVTPLKASAWISEHLPTYQATNISRLVGPAPGITQFVDPCQLPKLPPREPKVLVPGTPSSGSSSLHATSASDADVDPSMPKHEANQPSPHTSLSSNPRNPDSDDAIQSFSDPAIGANAKRSHSGLVIPLNEAGWLAPHPPLPVGPRVQEDASRFKKRRLHHSEHDETIVWTSVSTALSTSQPSQRKAISSITAPTALPQACSFRLLPTTDRPSRKSRKTAFSPPAAPSVTVAGGP
ncbi:hypothetical protein RSAG8_11750, partial [Rhizoctonia solani AG-8 WAC10335]